MLASAPETSSRRTDVAETLAMVLAGRDVCGVGEVCG